MNKKLSLLLKLLCVTFCVVIGAVLLAGCSKKVDINECMSDIRKTLYVGDCQNAFVSVVSGERENPYKYDGIKNNNVDFCIVSVFPNSKLEQDVVDVELKIGDTTHNVALEKSPYENAYMADLGSSIDEGKKITVICEELDMNIDLVCESIKWEVKSKDAIRIGSEELKEKMEEKVENGMLKGECYLKIIFDKSRQLKTYYWYFTFVSSDGGTSSCVIDTMTGKVLAKK